MRNPLTIDGLGESYRIATVRIHDLTTDLFETLFDHEGSPRVHPGEVANIITAYRSKLNLELDMIRESSTQHFEANYEPKQQEEGLFKLDWKSS